MTSDNGAEAVTWEATPVTIAPEFWAEHSVGDLRGRSEYWLGMQGRLTEPVHKAADEDHYRPIGWGEAISICSSTCHESTGWAMGVLLLLRGNIGRPPACSSSR